MTDRPVKFGDEVRVVRTGFVGKVASIHLGPTVVVRLNNHPLPFDEDELVHVDEQPTNPFQVGDLVIEKGHREPDDVVVHRVTSFIDILGATFIRTNSNHCLAVNTIALYHRPEPTPQPSPTDTIISAFNDMEKEIADLKAELADARKKLLRSRAETQHAIATHEHYKIFHPVH